MKEKRYVITAVLGAIMVVFGITALILKNTYAADVYSVTFDATGGTFTGSHYGQEKVIVRVMEGLTATDQKPEDPVRSDAEFLYWMLNNVRYDFSTPVDSDIVLCAKWSCENCEVPDEPTPTIPDNPKTADLPISIIMSIGLCAFGLSLFQYKLLKMTK
ncbi:MAG: InlB B-repeat-containing protein [Tenericutes bacterium]|nr:InlB B-repeat-containing protein [Mycoplasmatota bacterium]